MRFWKETFHAAPYCLSPGSVVPLCVLCSAETIKPSLFIEGFHILPKTMRTINHQSIKWVTAEVKQRSDVVLKCEAVLLGTVLCFLFVPYAFFHDPADVNKECMWSLLVFPHCVWCLLECSDWFLPLCEVLINTMFSLWSSHTDHWSHLLPQQWEEPQDHLD